MYYVTPNMIVGYTFRGYKKINQYKEIEYNRYGISLFSSFWITSLPSEKIDQEEWMAGQILLKFNFEYQHNYSQK